MLQRLVIDPAQLSAPAIALTPPQQHYLLRVLRLGQGDRFVAMDGQGQAWIAQLRQPDGTDRWLAEILEPVTVATELPISVTLVMALPKGNGFDDVVRQATELGVSCIAPVISDRTLLNPSAQKVERWRRIAQEAAEQSERQMVPTLLDPVPFRVSLESFATGTIGYFCVTRRSSPHLLTCLSTTRSESTSTITIAIGAEGGWTDAEVDQAIAVGYQPVSLGTRILRAVTAPIVALSLIAASYELRS
ncbi:16S rRNA (uracil(1498)-N(3))-methyltransferase [Pantanalinema rosaneae CENA516]|uniref:16S rRNA (uracil(1498)-N(3))-methyltransferase n=1 Tax=Pantanalinema rosaneae TaxID=1620701 RepID=UPI003D6EC614